jgi:hypothetical protein
MFDGELPLSLGRLAEKFNRSQFFDEKFYPISLYYLGMTTFLDEFTLGFPNLTVKTIFADYFNEVERLRMNDDLYVGFFRQFLKDGDWGALFAGYWERYLGQIPAQAFDKINENFIRTTFYTLCVQYLSHCYLFAIEVNHPPGRSDFEAVGRPGTPRANSAHVIEFKHFSKAEGAKGKVLSKKKPDPVELAQVDGYAADMEREFPWLKVQRHVCYTVAGKGFNFLSL